MAEDDCEVTKSSALSPLHTHPFHGTNFVFVVYVIFFLKRSLPFNSTGSHLLE